jgi:hypothetical protein
MPAMIIGCSNNSFEKAVPNKKEMRTYKLSFFMLASAISFVFITSIYLGGANIG